MFDPRTSRSALKSPILMYDAHGVTLSEFEQESGEGFYYEVLATVGEATREAIDRALQSIPSKAVPVFATDDEEDVCLGFWAAN